jgi:hypothetical protein
MPDLALGCLMKPFTAEDIHRSLAAAEDLMRGREALRPRMPVNLTLYDKVEEEGGRATARLHPLQAIAQDPARALDRRDAALSMSFAPDRGATVSGGAVGDGTTRPRRTG